MRNGALVLAFALCFASLSAAAPGEACDLSDKYRQMNGGVAAVNGGVLTLAQRGGDQLTFQKAGGVQVMGARSSWGAIQAGDRVIVAWLISDSPALAHQVCVLPGS